MNDDSKQVESAEQVESDVSDKSTNVKTTSASSSKKRFRITWLRRVVQCVAFVIFAVPILAVGWCLFGLGASYTDNALTTPASLPYFGTLSSVSIFGFNIMDPLAMLEIIVASKTFDPAWLLAALPPIIIYGVIRGRAFCGWVCPVNFALEGVDWVRRKLHIQVREGKIPRRVKIAVAGAVLVVSAIISVPVFELVSPIGAINKLIVFGSTSGIVFLVAIIIAELFFEHRVWCRSLCPLGGFYECIGRAGVVHVKIDTNKCTKCKSCKSVCLASPEILDSTINGEVTAVRAGDCMVCGACVDACPTRALKMGVGYGAKTQEKSGSNISFGSQADCVDKSKPE